MMAILSILKWNIIKMLIFILLNLFDAVTTYIGITTGKCDEANLILSKLFEMNIFLGLTTDNFGTLLNIPLMLSPG